MTTNTVVTPQQGDSAAVLAIRVAAGNLLTLIHAQEGLVSMQTTVAIDEEIRKAVQMVQVQGK